MTIFTQFIQANSILQSQLAFMATVPAERPAARIPADQIKGAFPSIVSDSNSTSRGIIADRIMDIGYGKAAKMARKSGMCFSLFYFLAFGRMPRKLPASIK